MTFQENLRHYREKAGYAQAKDFAAAIGVKYSTYIGYENQGREPKYDTLRRIAEALNVSIDTLLGFSGVDRYEEAKRLVIESGCTIEEEGEAVIVQMPSDFSHTVVHVNEPEYLIEIPFDDMETLFRCVNAGLSRFHSTLTPAKYDYIRREILLYKAQREYNE